MELNKPMKTARMMVKLGNNYFFIKVNDIDYIVTEKNYLRLYLADKSFLIRQTLNSFEERLDPDRFIRINRSTMVNIDRIKELRSVENYKYKVVLSDDKSWIWGRKFKKNLMRVLVS